MYVCVSLGKYEKVYSSNFGAYDVLAAMARIDLEYLRKVRLLIMILLQQILAS